VINLNKKLCEILDLLFKHGQYSKPFVVNFLQFFTGPECFYLKARLLSWRNEYDRALYEIEKGLKTVDSTRAEYLLCALKLSLLSKTGAKQTDKMIVKLKKGLHRIPPIARKLIISTILNHTIRSCGVEKIRIWGKLYENDLATWCAVQIAFARKLYRTGDINKSVRLLLNVYKTARRLPNPSQMISALNNAAWYLKKDHPYWALKISRQSVYWMGWYKEWEDASANIFDTLLELQILSHDNFEAFIKTILMLKMRDLNGSYMKKIQIWKDITLGTSMYRNQKRLRRWIGSIGNSMSDISRKTGIDRKVLTKIISGEVRNIKGETIRKIIQGSRNFDVFKAPYPIYNELVKIEIEKRFEEAIESLRQLPLSERQTLFISTYMAQIKRDKFYLSRKDKFKEAYEMLGEIGKFERYMFKRYETMEFMIDMMRAHPYIEGRKAVVRKAIDRMGKKKKEDFIHGYIELEEEDRKLLDRFLRNYGRYDGIRFGMRIDGPERVRAFAKRYRLKIQPCFIAYWCEEDGRTRRKLERILEII